MTSVGDVDFPDRVTVARNFPLKGDRIGDWRRASENRGKMRVIERDRPVALA